jgi:hypothetical protein
MLYALVRLWLPLRRALLAPLALLLGATIAAELAPFLYARHYADAIALGALAATLWVRGLRAGRAAVGRALAIAAAATWLLARLAKDRTLALRVRYDAPAGWRVHSPPLALDLTRRTPQSVRR